MKPLNKSLFFLICIISFFMLGCNSLPYGIKGVRGDYNIIFNGRYYGKGIPTPEIMKPYLNKEIKSVDFEPRVLIALKHLITNQMFLQHYKRNKREFKRYRKLLNKYPRSSGDCACQDDFKNTKLYNLFKVKDNPYRIYNIGSEIPFGVAFNIEVNFKIRITEITDSLIMKDLSNKISDKGNYLNSRNEFCVYKIEEIKRDMGSGGITCFNKCEQNFELLKNTYFAISKWPVGRQASRTADPTNMTKFVAFIPLSPKYSIHKYTITNLWNFFVELDPYKSNPKNYQNYIFYLRMYLCGKYSNVIFEPAKSKNATIESKFNDITYLKSIGDYHHYGFYSDIYKKDMVAIVDTKHPEKIKVKNYNPRNYGNR